MAIVMTGIENRPTDAELRILQVLWCRGAATVRQIHADLGGETAYTTALKLLQIMHEKGFVTRDTSARAHVYSATQQREEVEKGLVGDLLKKVFSGSAGRLVLRALATERISAEERREIEELLRSMPEDSGEPEVAS